MLCRRFNVATVNHRRNQDKNSPAKATPLPLCPPLPRRAAAANTDKRVAEKSSMDSTEIRRSVADAIQRLTSI